MTRSVVQVHISPPFPNKILDFRPKGDFLLPSAARSIGENILAVPGSRGYFRLPLPPFLALGGGGFYDIIKEQTIYF